jgi:hypothetical protein
MSYCRVGSSVAAGIRLEFHPVCIQRILQVLAVSACTTQVPAQPPASPAAVAFGNGVRVSWTASASPGVVGYSVYRSASPADANPELAGSTATLQFDDASLGLHYCRVRAVRATDASAFSAEVAATPVCTSSAGVAIATASRPVAVGAADLNGDGREDLALLCRGIDVAALCFGQGAGGVGNGAFSAPVEMTTLPGVRCLAITDVNGDQLPDLIYGYSSFNSSGLRVFRADGSLGAPPGTFMGETGIAYLQYAPNAIVSADTDEDGLEDILVATDGGVLQLRALGANGVANGGFVGPRTVPDGMNTQDVLAHDFDGDGVLDLAISGTQGLGPAREQQRRQGDGTFLVATAMPAGSRPAASR